MRTLLLSLLLCIPAFSQTMPACNASAPISVSASGLTQIVAPYSPAAIRICHISLSSFATTHITLDYGTGSACGTGTTALSGAFQSVITMDLSFGRDTGPVVPAGKAFCINSSVATTIGGLVTYSTY